LEFAGVGLLRVLLGLLGLERASGFMGWCWQTIAPYTKRHPRALAQLHAAMPHFEAAEREKIITQMWNNLGRTFAEGALLDVLMAQPQRITVEQPHLVESLKAGEGKQGAIMVSMHAANWEALGIPLAQSGLAVAGLYQGVRNPLLERSLLAQREQLYLAGMITKGSNAMKRIVALLRSGGAVAMLADQRQHSRGVMVPFFGAYAPSTPLPATLALRTGSRLILGRCKRVGPVAFSIELKPLEITATDDHEADVARVTAQINAQFEAWITERPHEWMWAHRRWSRQVREQ
jgi:KDO2-lipid IV(A) lauroyltransferase